MASAGTSKRLSVLLTAYGDHPDVSVRTIRSLAATPNLAQRCDVHAAANVCCRPTLSALRDALDRGIFTSLIESSVNRHKDPMLRMMRDVVSTPYLLILDDDTHVRDGWLDALLSFLERETPLDVAGELYEFPRSHHYQQIAEKRPWWRGRQFVPPRLANRVLFPTGGFVLARTEFLRSHDWPDKAMVIEHDDVLLGDLVGQNGGILKALPESVLNCVSINDGPRRWKPEEGRNDAQERSVLAVPAASTAAKPPGPVRKISVAQALDYAAKYLQQGRYSDAEIACRRVLAGQPANPTALHLLGLTAHRTERHRLAVEMIQKAIAAQPDAPEYRNNLGNVLAKLGKLSEAQVTFRRAIEIKRDYPEAHNNLANVLGREGKTQEAIELYRRAIALKSDYAEAYLNLAHVLRKRGELAEMTACFKKAAEINGSSVDAYSGWALALQDQGLLEEAMETIGKAVELAPGHPQLRLNRALLMLMAGDFARGWEEYEWRWKVAGNNSYTFRFTQPLWDGAELAGKTILLHCEQGLGSTIQFIRYVELVQQRGGKVIVECQPPVKAMLCDALDGVAVLARGEKLPAFDVQAPLMSLPRILKTTLASIPTRTPYLKARPELVEQWKAELGRYPGLKVGIAWQGNPAYGGDRDRSVPLEHFAVLSKVPGVHLLSLQKRNGLDQLAEASEELTLVDLAAKLDEKTAPFLDTAAVMMGLDLIVTSDTSISHLAGALGRPVWVALCHSADWRWMRHREDCPWHPTMRLFRQERPGDWEGLFRRIAGELAAVAGKR